MAQVARSTRAHLDTGTAQFAPQLSGGVPELRAGEDLDAFAACRIDETDGRVYMSSGAAADANARVVGFTPRSAKTGEPITLFGNGIRLKYSDGLLTTFGAPLYLDTVAGRLNDAPTLGGTTLIAHVVNANDIVVAGLPAGY